MTGKRILAWMAILAFLVLLVLLMVFAFTGAPREYLIALLFLLMIVPTVIYIFMWAMGLFRKKDEEEQE